MRKRVQTKIEKTELIFTILKQISENIDSKLKIKALMKQ